MAAKQVPAEKTNWLASAEQQFWFDQFAQAPDHQRPIGGDQFALNFQQFQAFLKATLYCYLEKFPTESTDTDRNDNCLAQQTNGRRNGPPLEPLDVDTGSCELSKVQEMHLFKRFDLDNDHLISRDEFAQLCQKWLNQVFRPVCALVVVDVQNDFIDGSLALINGPARQDGAEVVPVVNELVDMFQMHKATIVYTQDWHPQDHVSFHSNLHLRKYTIKGGMANQHANRDNKQFTKTDRDFKYKRLVPKANMFDTVVFEEGRVEQKLWPIHCVRNSWGAQFHPKLKLAPDSIRIQKGTLSHVDAYSAFWDNMRMNETGLRQELINRRISDLFFCGLATDYCVAASALDSTKAGFVTFVVDDACRGIDEKEIEQRKETLQDGGAFIVGSGLVASYLALANGTEFDSVSSSRHCLSRSLIKSITYRKAFC